jgi:Protein of unknown function (DUF3485)
MNLFGKVIHQHPLSLRRQSDCSADGCWGASLEFPGAFVSPHSPVVCIPGNGWSITKLERASYGAEQPLNRAIIERNGSKQLVYYWYEERGRSIASEYWSKWYLLSDAITKESIRWALVRLITAVSPNEHERDADNRVQLFMHDLLPRLGGYLPSDAAPNSPQLSIEPRTRSKHHV